MESKEKRLIKVAGVTMVALVVTIIILLILAGVVITLVVGDNGIITRAKRATEIYKEAEENEQIQLNNLYTQLASINNENSKSVTIYGDQESINSITNVPVTINVDGSGVNATKAYNVTINRPSGVRAISEKKATITITFGDEKQKEVDITNVISHRNLSSNLTANIVGTSSNVNAIVKGVQSVIDSITSENITAYLDLEGYGVGEYDVPVKIENDDPKLNYVVGTTVKVRITNASTTS